MWNPRGGNQEMLVAVALDKDKRSQNALKWALDHVLTRGQTVRLIHVDQPQFLPIVHHHNGSLLASVSNNNGGNRQGPNDMGSEFFLPYRCLCSRREVQWETVTLKEPDIARALIDYVSLNRVDTLVLGAPNNGISRFFKTDIPSTVMRGAPYFCTVYGISKGKVTSKRDALHPLPSISVHDRTRPQLSNSNVDIDSIARATDTRLPDECTIPETEISSLMNSGRLSTDSMSFDFYDKLGSELIAKIPPMSSDPFIVDSDSDINELSPTYNKETASTPSSQQKYEEMEEKTRMLELQMKQTMDMYHAACKEALTAKQKARELQLLKLEDERRVKEAERAKDYALAIAKEEREKCKVALMVAKAAKREVEQELQKRLNAEILFKAFDEEAANRKMKLDSLGHSHVVLRYQSLLHIVVVLLVFYFYF